MPTTVSTTPRTTVSELRKTMERQQTDHNSEVKVLREGLADLVLAIEDRGWAVPGTNSYMTTGLDVYQLQIVADSLRTWLSSGSLIKRIAELRGTTIYGDGVGFSNYDKAKKPFENSQNNIDMLFSAEALMEINRAHCTDGTIVFLVHNKTKEIQRYTLQQMGQPFVDASNNERIWFVRRMFVKRDTQHPLGVQIDEFIPTDVCPPEELNNPNIVEETGNTIPINKNYTAVTWRVNGQVGWPFGIPDLLPALQWAEKYTDYLKDQSKFAKAIAQIAWQFRAQNPDQMQKMAAALRPDGIGDTMGLTPGMDMKPLSGNSDIVFVNGKPLAAQAAAAGEVMVEDVLAERDSTASGSTLDPTVLNMAAARRSSATSFFKRIGKLLGAPNLEVIWPNLSSESPFREAQMIIAAWDTGTFFAEEIRPALAQRLRVPLVKGDAPPKDVLIPGTQAAVKASAPPALPAPGAEPDPTLIPGNKPGTSAGHSNAQGKDALGVGKPSAGDHTARNRGELPKK